MNNQIQQVGGQAREVTKLEQIEANLKSLHTHAYNLLERIRDMADRHLGPEPRSVPNAAPVGTGLAAAPIAPTVRRLSEECSNIEAVLSGIDVEIGRLRQL